MGTDFRCRDSERSSRRHTYLASSIFLVRSFLGILAKAAEALPVGRLVRGLLLLLTGWMALALSMHLFPGFTSPPLAPAMRFSPTGIPFTPHANFDTTSAGLILMAVYCNPQLTDWKRVCA